MVFQDPMSSLNPAHSILDVVQMPLLVAGRGDSKQRRAAAIETLRSVGLDGEQIGGRRSYELSGGQCQRVSIARALTLGPDLLVCDEPVSALDVSVQAQILNLLRQLQRDLGVSYLFITHNIGVVEYIADQVAVMQRGLIEELGSVESVLGAPQTDYTRTLLAAVPRIAIPAPG